MKIGIIGININTYELNYGAILHCWAFQKLLQSIDNGKIDKIEIVNYVPNHVNGKNVKYPFIVSFKQRNIRDVLKSIAVAKEYAQRYDSLKNFNEREFNIGKRYTNNELSDAKLDYDCIIVESDIVWDKIDHGNFDSTFFLALPSMKKMRRIAYGPDTGKLRIEDGKTKSSLEKLLKNVDYISSRGNSPAEILRQCTDKSVTSVLDPTLCIDAKQYDNIAAPRIIKKRYCLCYYIDYDEKMLRDCRSYAKEQGLKVVTMTSRLSTKKAIITLNRKTYKMGVEEFISLIKHSETIFTNSFHAGCISIQYKKEFFAYPRGMERKVLDLCEMLGLENHYIDEIDIPKSRINYEHLNVRLNALKDESISWLKNALDL